MKQNYICPVETAILKLFLYSVTTKASASLFYNFKFGLYILLNWLFSKHPHSICIFFLQTCFLLPFSYVILCLFHIQNSSLFDLQS